MAKPVLAAYGGHLHRREKQICSEEAVGFGGLRCLT